MRSRLFLTLALAAAFAMPGKAQVGEEPEGAGLPPTLPPPGGGDVDVVEPTAEAGDPLTDALRLELQKHHWNMARIERIGWLATMDNRELLRNRASSLRELEERRHEAALERIVARGGGPVNEEGRAGDEERSRKGAER